MALGSRKEAVGDRLSAFGQPRALFFRRLGIGRVEFFLMDVRKPTRLTEQVKAAG
jgi:hypothetical protein